MACAKQVSSVAGGNKVQRRAALTNFTTLGAAGGLLAGLLEAYLMSSTPRLSALTHPDVSYVVWFLAPFIDLLLFASLGAVLGILAVEPPDTSTSVRNRIVAALGLGALGGYAGLAFLLLRVGFLGRSFSEKAITTVEWSLGSFAAVFTSAFLVFQTRWRSLPDALAAETPRPIRALSRLILGFAFVGFCGIGAYVVFRHPMPWIEVQANTNPPKGARNIILISLDTVRADRLSSYGYSRPTTPNLDRIAARGVLFENAIAAAPWTLASHASILTGFLPHQHGADFVRPLDAGLLTLAEILRSHGYQTAGFTSNLYYGQDGWGMGQGFDVYEDDGFSLRHNLALTLLGRRVLQPLYEGAIRADRLDRRSEGDVNRDVLHWFGLHAERPFFIFINSIDAHLPYFAPAPYDDRFGRVTAVPLRKWRLIKASHTPRPFGPAEQASLIAGYDNCLAYLDAKVGELVQSLSKSAAWSHTVLIITSDHGESLGEHGEYGHGETAYREVLHVPLIFTGPGIPSRQRIGEVVETRDLFSTALDLALPASQRYSARSLRRYWTAGLAPNPESGQAVSELAPNPSWLGSGLFASASLTTPEWHLIHNADGRTELYHWPTDPGEASNLGASPEEQKILRTLEERLYGSIAKSLQPWNGREYLDALDQPGYAFRRDFILRHKLPMDFPILPSAVGGNKRTKPEDLELLKSLPYP